MLGYMLKKEYEKWIADPNNKDILDFIAKMVVDYNANPDHLQQVLENQNWFKKS